MLPLAGSQYPCRLSWHLAVHRPGNTRQISRKIVFRDVLLAIIISVGIIIKFTFQRLDIQDSGQIFAGLFIIFIRSNHYFLMPGSTFKGFFSIDNSPRVVIIFLMLIYIGTNFIHHNWTRDEGPQRGVIKWDVISYYGYLPATFIHGDPSLDFLDEGEIDNDNKFWWSPAENGRKIIYMSCGLSIMYAPFFFMAHALAPVFGEARDGFGSTYQFFLVWGALVYVAIGFIYLKKILLRYFAPLVTAITLLLIGLGTNLYYYSTHEAAMSHAYNFVLIIGFFHTLLRWYEETSWRRTFLLGLLFGLIVLIRPTNILVIMLLLFWGIDSWTSFRLPWIPQFLYWKMITGQFIYYSYGAHGDRFYFDNPHIIESLFSYRKGWLLYTPVMIFAIIGLIPLKKMIRGARFSIILYLVLMIYVMSCWWTWWFGGGFGGRIYIDMYGIMALPLAALITVIIAHKKKLVQYGLTGFLALLMFFQLLQTRHYVGTAIHWDSMSKKAYFLNFMRPWHSVDYMSLLSRHDEELCRKGIYVYYDMSEDWSNLQGILDEEGIVMMMEEIDQNRTLPGDIRRYARRMNIPVEEATRMTAERMLYMKRDHPFER
jgi:hypothetical protein